MAEKATMFSKELVNTGRQLELDLLKTVVIFFMILIHVFEVGFSYEWEDLFFCDMTPCTAIIFALCNGVTAFSFMVCMGTTFLFSRNHDAGGIKRGWHLILAWIILAAAINLPCSLIFHARSGMTVGEYYLTLVFSSDILFTAGVFFLFMGATKKLNLKLSAITAIAIALFTLGQFVYLEESATSDLVSAVLGNFIITDYTAFPVLNWLIVPIIGIWFGKMLRHCANKDRFYAILGTGGVLVSAGMLFFAGLFQKEISEIADPCLFYELDVVSLPISCGLFSTLVSLCHFCVRLFKLKWFICFYQYCSRNLTVIYFMQWLLVSWLFFFFPVIHEKTAVWKGIPIGLLIYGLSLAGTEVYCRLKRKFTGTRTAIL